MQTPGTIPGPNLGRVFGVSIGSGRVLPRLGLRQLLLLPYLRHLELSVDVSGDLARLGDDG